MNDNNSASIMAPSAGYSITLRLRIRNQPGFFASVVEMLAREGGSLAEVTLLAADFDYTIRDVTVACSGEVNRDLILQSLIALSGVELIEWQDDTFAMHSSGKLEVNPKTRLFTRDDLARAYTPGVARVCEAIKEEPEKVWSCTIKRNAVAVISDGSAVLGLGNIGAAASMPVMEGKAVLFKQFANIDAYPIVLKTQDVEEIIATVKCISTGFGGINLEDISAPRCFEIEERLDAELDIPVFHDDQHGTAVVVLAGVINALRIIPKKLSELKIVISGFGAGGVAITRILLESGAQNIIPCDSIGAVYRGREKGMNLVKEKLIAVTNPDNVRGTLAECLRGADLFIGVSQPNIVSAATIRTMAKDPIVFALSNPVPEIYPQELVGIARVIATGRSDFANQINNVLAFPGIFRGALDSLASTITVGMRLSAAHAIARRISDSRLSESCIVPNTFEAGVAECVAAAVREQAIIDKVARRETFPVSTLQGRHRPDHWGRERFFGE